MNSPRRVFVVSARAEAPVVEAPLPPSPIRRQRLVLALPLLAGGAALALALAGEAARRSGPEGPANAEWGPRLLAGAAATKRAHEGNSVKLSGPDPD